MTRRSNVVGWIIAVVVLLLLADLYLASTGNPGAIYPNIATMTPMPGQVWGTQQAQQQAGR